MVSQLTTRSYPQSTSPLGTSQSRAWFYEGTDSSSGTWCCDAWHCSGTNPASRGGFKTCGEALNFAEDKLRQLDNSTAELHQVA